MFMENCHKNKKIEDSEATLGIYDIFEERRKGGGRVLDFWSENGGFIGSWGGVDHTAEKFLPGYLENGTQGLSS